MGLFDSVLIIAVSVAFVYSHPTFDSVILSSHQYEFTVKQTKVLGVNATCFLLKTVL